METVYAIRDTAGRLVAEHVRVETPAGKRMYWRLGDGTIGLDGVGTADLPLYGSETLPDVPVGRTVVITEGERAALALRPYVPVVASVTGAAGTPGEDAVAVLLPYDVVTWEDRDGPGEGHMRRMAASLIRLGGRARRLRWGTRKGDDAADFVARGGTPDVLGLLLDGAEPWQIKAPPPVERPRYEHRADDSRVEDARSHLIRVVEERLGPPKKRLGRSLFWPCPFHAERTPSFKVDLREPFYRCFGCEARGDVFTFLRAMEGVGFKDALGTLAPARPLGAAIPW